MSTSKGIVFGLHGRKRAGKDTAADALVSELGFVKHQFAAVLKEALEVIFGWPVWKWEDGDWKETPNAAAGGRTPREVAQSLGTDWGRSMVFSNIWVDRAMERAENSMTFGDNVVFTDVRFPNEARAIRSRGGKIIQIIRTDQEPNTDTHGSEQPLPSTLIDGVVAAPTGVLTRLQLEVSSAVAEWINRDKWTLRPPVQ